MQREVANPETCFEVVLSPAGAAVTALEHDLQRGDTRGGGPVGDRPGLPAGRLGVRPAPGRLAATWHEVLLQSST